MHCALVLILSDTSFLFFNSLDNAYLHLVSLLNADTPGRRGKWALLPADPPLCAEARPSSTLFRLTHAILRGGHCLHPTCAAFREEAAGPRAPDLQVTEAT